MEHPAHQLAGMAADAAEELSGYLAPEVDVPWELTEDDHHGLLPRLCDAVSRLAGCIGAIAQKTGDDDAKRQLTVGARRMLDGCEHVRAAQTALIPPAGSAGLNPSQRDPGS